MQKRNSAYNDGPVGKRSHISPHNIEARQKNPERVENRNRLSNMPTERRRESRLQSASKTENA